MSQKDEANFYVILFKLSGYLKISLRLSQNITKIKFNFNTFLFTSLHINFRTSSHDKCSDATNANMHLCRELK